MEIPPGRWLGTGAQTTHAGHTGVEELQSPADTGNLACAEHSGPVKALQHGSPAHPFPDNPPQ